MKQGYLMHARLQRKVPWFCTCLALLILSGCKPSEQLPGPGVANSSEERSSDPARQLLEKLVAAYREAGHYQDRGEVTLSYRLQGSLQRCTRHPDATTGLSWLDRSVTRFKISRQRMTICG